MFDLFGVPLHALTLDDLRAFLEDAPAEGLVWEAKGTAVHPDSVRKHACAFANTDQGGFLILGASENKKPAAGEARWTLDGFDVRDDDGPTTWLSHIIGAALRPVPRLDIRAFEVDAERHVAVIGIEPLADPPCMVGGTVYVRMPGMSQAIIEPSRLSELNARGRHAHDRARSAADGAAAHLMEVFAEAHSERDAWRDGVLDLVVSVAPLAAAGDVGDRLFTRSFEARMLEDVSQLQSHGPLSSSSLPLHSQTTVTAMGTNPLFGATWLGEAAWNGTVALGRTDPAAGSGETVDEIVTRIDRAWTIADEWARALGAIGPAYVAIYLRGPRFDTGTEPVTLHRGPVQGPPSLPEKAHVEREIRRCCGERGAYEPEPET